MRSDRAMPLGPGGAQTSTARTADLRPARCQSRRWRNQQTDPAHPPLLRRALRAADRLSILIGRGGGRALSHRDAEALQRGNRRPCGRRLASQGAARQRPRLTGSPLGSLPHIRIRFFETRFIIRNVICRTHSVYFHVQNSAGKLQINFLARNVFTMFSQPYAIVPVAAKTTSNLPAKNSDALVAF